MAILKGAVIVAGISLFLVALENYFDHPQEDPLPERITQWHNNGNYTNVHGHRMFYYLAGKLDETENVVIFIHGFPTSSYDYHRALDYLLDLLPNFKLVFFDHVGFGFSDKPQEDYEFTIHDHAENALELFRQLEIKTAHMVAHDMGDSVLTEIILRKHLKLLPNHFDEFFKTFTFTNGGMVYEKINFRIGQRLLLLPYIGPLISHFQVTFPGLAKRFSTQQLSSIMNHENEDLKNEDIDAIQRLIRWNDGHLITHKLGSYLKDRQRFQSRWFRALPHIAKPTMLFWADSDPVSPMDIPKHLAQFVFKPEAITGKVLRKAGHFLMLEEPVKWSEVVADFVLSHPG